ncbi:MAG TPA: efflux RND transporter periplasmic adaptor subunit [Anaeromyxobacteraceae bacterium]|nr:efflux RND transporter periplasmic adaptor subunit [Anaeromyxobacteraceae bacterium]
MTPRRLLVLALVVLAAALGVWRFRAARDRARPQLETATLDRAHIVAKVTATGTLSAIVTVQVGTQVSGTIQALFADWNTPVKKGQRIAKIDPALFEAAVEQARANLVAAEGNLQKSIAQAVDAKRQRDRNRLLVDQKLIAQADYDTSDANAAAAVAQVEASRGAVEQARAALDQANVNLAYTNIVSPTNGVIISRNVDVGQTVAASLQAPVLFVIAEDLAKMQIDTSVAESDVGRIRPAMKVTFTVDAYPAEVFQGTVRQIRYAPQTVQNVVTYDAVIDVANADQKLLPGMTANVVFVYADKEDALRVPNAALRFRPPPAFLARAKAGAQAGSGRPAAPPSNGKDGGGAGTGGPPDRRTVWVLRAGEPVAVRIRTGISDGTYTEVVAGELAAGDVVITDAALPAGGGPPQGGMGLRRL